MAAYRKLNADIERVSEMYFLISLRLSIPGGILPPLITTLLNYFVYDLGDESYVIPYPILYVLKYEVKRVEKTICNLSFPIQRLPFNWRTPFGYLMALICETCAFICMVCMGSPCVGIFIGSCWLLTAFMKDITYDLSNLSADVKLKRSKQKINAQFTSIVQDFSDAIQLSGINFLYSSGTSIESSNLHLGWLRISAWTRNLSSRSCSCGCSASFVIHSLYSNW